MTPPDNAPHNALRAYNEAHADEAIVGIPAPMEPGCYLDGARGHYITRDMIEMAQGFGYILDPFAQYTIARYGEGGDIADYPHEAMHDLADEILSWLNGGPNTGPDRAIPGQNSPPAIPEGAVWEFNDGDFGLYQYGAFGEY